MKHKQNKYIYGNYNAAVVSVSIDKILIDIWFISSI